MKTMILTAFLAFVGQSAMASETKICEKLYQVAQSNCIKSMCEEFEANGGGDCQGASDFGVALQMCMEDEFYYVIEAYNKKYPRKKVKCEEM